MSRLWKWVLSGLGGLALLFGVYFIGRRNRLGVVNLEVATKQLEAANAQHDKLSQQLATLHDKRTEILSDILAEATKPVGGTAPTNAEVLLRLRAHGLVE